MPMVNRGRVPAAARSAKTPATMPGVNSFEDSPYRPPVTTGMFCPGARGVRLGQRAEHVEEQRLAQRAGFLGPVQHGHPARRGRQRGEQVGGRERAGTAGP